MENESKAMDLIRQIVKSKKLRVRLERFKKDERLLNILTGMEKSFAGVQENELRLERLLALELEFNEQDWVKEKNAEFEKLNPDAQNQILKDAYRR